MLGLCVADVVQQRALWHRVGRSSALRCRSGHRVWQSSRRVLRRGACRCEAKKKFSGIGSRYIPTGMGDMGTAAGCGIGFGAIAIGFDGSMLGCPGLLLPGVNIGQRERRAYTRTYTHTTVHASANTLHT